MSVYLHKNTPFLYIFIPFGTESQIDLSDIHPLSPSEVHVEPHKKQLHVTLAYNFPSDHLPSLEKLAKGIEVKLGCDWLAVLFSRDIRFANHEVAATQT